MPLLVEISAPTSHTKLTTTFISISDSMVSYSSKPSKMDDHSYLISLRLQN